MTFHLVIEDDMTGPVTENFIPFDQVVEAAIDLGVLSEAGVNWTAVVSALPGVVGTMTGLDMTKYDLIWDFDALGWRLVRRGAP